MMNGKKFGRGKPILLFGGSAPPKTNIIPEPANNLEIANPIRVSEQIHVENPMFAMFAYYRYYIMQEKYKSIVKFNLDHSKYFEKRDEIIEYVDNKDFLLYWQACILITIAV